MMMTNQSIKSAKEKLKEISAWKTKEGKNVPGVDSTQDLTDKQLPTVYGKVKAAYAEWQNAEPGN